MVLEKKHSVKFWIIFWLLATLFLSVWFLYWNYKNKGLAATVSGVMSVAPLNESKKQQYQSLALLGEYFLNAKPKTFLILFQNNLEIRPGGGFIGAFAIIKTKGGSIESMEMHDLSNFDSRIPNTIEPPYPMKEVGFVQFWKMRDSNFSPDFSINAKKAEEFYLLGEGKVKIDGVIGVTANMLTSLLQVTGPIQIEGYPGTYDSKNAIIALEYQVEQAFKEQGIEKSERKSIMKDLAAEIEKRILKLSQAQKIALGKILLEDLKQKDIQFHFKDTKIQAAIEKAGWDGSLDKKWSKDFLMVVDANLGSFKSDYYVKRSIDYTVDLSQDKPIAKLKVIYDHTAVQKDWLTKNYLTYLRVYVPQETQIVSTNGLEVKSGQELGRQFWGTIVRVPLNESKTIEFSYMLPQSMINEYQLLIQKQAGLIDVPIAVHIIEKNGKQVDYEKKLNSDLKF